MALYGSGPPCDVCHVRGQPSYGATVANVDSLFSKYSTFVDRHNNGEELSNHFGKNISLAAEEYMKYNGRLPETIVIYRDGVGEGNFKTVFEYEVEAIRSALRRIYQGPYRLVFVVVSKRLNTRFFEGRDNPAPGTVVDSVVTSPIRYDFFLISQHVRCGTVSPISYNVLYDNTDLTPDDIQQMTYRLCHMYFNFSGQIKVPAPCQLAHKLAFLCAKNLKHAPNPRLGPNLYFL